METPKKTKKNTQVVATVELSVTEDVKKKGRKPKGAKLIVLDKDKETVKPQLSNIILHLKFSTKEYLDYINNTNKMSIDGMQYVPVVMSPEVVAYNTEKQGIMCSVFNETATNTLEPAYKECVSNEYCSACANKLTDITDKENEISDKEINAKLRQLSINLKTQNEKKSACFWCTYEFDNPTCYIPKQETDSIIYAYGSFCRPECAVAYLMKETMDDSVKFERLHLINHIYGKIYGYTKNIKPAPDPHYTLEKFFGTMTIQEYRKLLKTNHMLLTIDKPFARLVPEIHEETDEGLLNAGKPVTYKVKRQSEQVAGPSKTNIVKNVFGLQK
jgi:hypothetical protein